MRTRTSRLLSASFAPALIALVGVLAIGGTAMAREPQDVPAKPAAVEKKHEKTGKGHHHRHHGAHKQHRKTIANP
jgi:hypothetical protein